MFEFQLRFHWGLFLRVQLKVNQHYSSGNGLAPNRRQAITWSILTQLIDAHLRDTRRDGLKLFLQNTHFFKSNEISNNITYIYLLFLKFSPITGIRGCSWRYQCFRWSFKVNCALSNHLCMILSLRNMCNNNDISFIVKWNIWCILCVWPFLNQFSCLNF